MLSSPSSSTSFFSSSLRSFSTSVPRPLPYPSKFSLAMFDTYIVRIFVSHFLNPTGQDFIWGTGPVAVRYPNCKNFFHKMCAPYADRYEKQLLPAGVEPFREDVSLLKSSRLTCIYTESSIKVAALLFKPEVLKMTCTKKYVYMCEVAYSSSECMSQSDASLVHSYFKFQGYCSDVEHKMYAYHVKQRLVLTT